jgi:hypothetical protein
VSDAAPECQRPFLRRSMPYRHVKTCITGLDAVPEFQRSFSPESMLHLHVKTYVAAFAAVAPTRASDRERG